MRRCHLLLACLLGCASTDPTGPGAGSGETVRLVYGWKPGLEAWVSLRGTHIARADEGEKKVGMTMSYRLSTAAAGANLHIHHSDPSKMTFEPEKPSAAEMGDLAAEVVSSTPDLLIGPDGQLAGIHELSRYTAQLSAAAAKSLSPEQASKVMPILERTVVGEQALLAGAADHWGGLVALWIDAELEVGSSYTHSVSVPHPLFPQKQVKTDYEFRATRWMPCSRDGVARRCVELLMVATTDPEDTKRLLEEVMRELAGLAKQPVTSMPVFSEAYTQIVVLLVTEPDGLVPHAYSNTEIVDGTVRVEGNELPVHREKRVEYQFEY